MNTTGLSSRDVIVIPAYNERKVIRDVVRELLPLGARVVVVDDASSDGTTQALAGLPVHVVTHVVNLGQGAALRTGMEYAIDLSPRYVVTFDADGQHDPADLAALVGALEESGADVALGSRFLGDASAVPWARRGLLRLATWFTRLSTGIAVTDAHNGLRAFTADGAAAVRISQRRMAHASEILELVKTHRLRMVEVPVTVRYSAYSMAKGQSALGAVDILHDLFFGRLSK